MATGGVPTGSTLWGNAARRGALPARVSILMGISDQSEQNQLGVVNFPVGFPPEDRASIIGRKSSERGPQMASG